jgi:hypothetical protein
MPQKPFGLILILPIHEESEIAPDRCQELSVFYGLISGADYLNI